VPIDNNWVENRIHPWALARSNWLFAASLRSGQRAAAVMTLIQSAKLNGHDPYVYLKYVLTRLPTHKNNATDELLPHNWTTAVISKVRWPSAYVRAGYAYVVHDKCPLRTKWTLIMTTATSGSRLVYRTLTGFRQYTPSLKCGIFVEDRYKDNSLFLFFSYWDYKVNVSGTIDSSE
jgi:transposase